MQNRCSHCYNLGHNRRTCDVLQAQLESHAAQGGQYAIERLARRGKGKKKEDRKCSFCSFTGHDRRTCDIISRFVEADSELTLKTRSIFKDRMEAQGFGIGTLVEFGLRDYNFRTCQYENKTFVGVVNKIHWDEIDHRTLKGQVRTIRVAYFESSNSKKGPETKVQHDRNMCLPRAILEDTSTIAEGESEIRLPHDYTVRVLAPVDGVKVPGSFLSKKAIEKLSRDLTKELNEWSYTVRDTLNKATGKLILD